MRKHVPLDEKLTALREADTLRHWYSLDDRRVCVLCNRLITGRMIQVWQGKSGEYQLRCPTPGCPSEPRDWFDHGAMAPTAGAGSF